MALVDSFRARDLLHVADHNALEAYRLSPRDKCVAPLLPPDMDHDGILDAVDKCPTEPEDKDGFEDADGCPDPDNDKDGVRDTADQCPDVPAGPSPDPRRPGCPATDRDGDTFEDSVDRCPDQAETFNGVADDD